MQNTVASWSRPRLILVVTNLLEWPSAMPHALHEAKLSGAAVLLAHAAGPCPLRDNPQDRSPIVLGDGTNSSVRITLNRMATIFERQGIMCEPVILRGGAVEQIQLLVRNRNVDRVIIASSSPRGVERLLVGSPAEELTTALDIPVCIVGPGAYSDPIRDAGPVRILAATSLNPVALLCAQFGASLAEVQSGSLTLLHVIDSEEINIRPQGSPECLTQRELEHHLAAMASDRRAADIVIRRGHPATEILELASSISARFVVLGSPRDGSVSRILGDSVIPRVVREARCPVITLKPTERQGLFAVMNHLQFANALQ